MRKLTLLATTAIAAMAFMASAAAPASADRPFMLENQYGVPCNPCHEEFEGTATLDSHDVGWPAGTCDIRFDAYAYSNGSFGTAGMDVTDCTYLFAGTEACGGSWDGQVRLPDTGPVKVDMTMCLDTDTSPPQDRDVTFKVVVDSPGVLAWDQIASTTYGPWQFDVVDSYFVDVNEEDLHLVLL